MLELKASTLDNPTQHGRPSAGIYIYTHIQTVYYLVPAGNWHPLRVPQLAWPYATNPLACWPQTTYTTPYIQPMDNRLLPTIQCLYSSRILATDTLLV